MAEGEYSSGPSSIAMLSCELRILLTAQTSTLDNSTIERSGGRSTFYLPRVAVSPTACIPILKGRTIREKSRRTPRSHFPAVIR
jgi:hypothetical protein